MSLILEMQDCCNAQKSSGIIHETSRQNEEKSHDHFKCRKSIFQNSTTIQNKCSTNWK